MTQHCVTSNKHVNSYRIAAGFLNCWLMSHGDEASGTGASRTSRKPSSSTRAMLISSRSTRLTTSVVVVFPEALRRSDEVLNITRDDADTLVQKAAIAQAEGDLPRASALLSGLRLAAGNPEGLETQVYQAILERRPAQIIPRLKELLAKPDPALGSFNGELRFWLGWAQEVAGDHAGARESWRQAHSEMEPFLKEQPDNSIPIGDLALINMGLGDKAAALAFSERAIAANPIEKDVATGPMPIEILARVAAGIGEPDRAIAALQKLLSIPYVGALAWGMPLTPALLRLDPMFDPLRKGSAFPKTLRGKAAVNPQCVKDLEIIADNLHKAGWSWGCVLAIDSRGRTIFIADAHRNDGKRFVVRCGREKLRLILAFLRLKEREIFAVALFPQFLHRNKAKRGGVHTEPLTGRGRAVIKDVAEMGIARFPPDLGALHPVRSIALFRHAVWLNRLREARPTRAAIEFVERAEQRCARDDVDIDSRVVIVPVGVVKRSFRAAFTRHLILVLR